MPKAKKSKSAKANEVNAETTAATKDEAVSSQVAADQQNNTQSQANEVDKLDTPNCAEQEEKKESATEVKQSEKTDQEAKAAEQSDKDTSSKLKDEPKDEKSESKDDKSEAKDDKSEAKDEKSEAKDAAKSEDKEIKIAKTGSTPKVKSLYPSADDKPIDDEFKSRIIVITSGKGGVGKTTTAGAISTGLALKGHKTVVIDFDVGLRNLDLIMGCERRVVFDLISVLHGEASLNQTLIKDRHTKDLYILPASQTRDKDALTYHGVGLVLKELSEMGFEYIICDSPAGIETGALMALYYADEAIVTTNPEVSSVRDSDRIIGIINAKSRRAVNNLEEVKSTLLITRYSPSRVESGEMLSFEDVLGLLTIPLLGVIPESPDVLKASNTGDPIILNQKSIAGQAYSDTVERILGNDVPLRFVHEKKGFFQKLLGK